MNSATDMEELDEEEMLMRAIALSLEEVEDEEQEEEEMQQENKKKELVEELEEVQGPGEPMKKVHLHRWLDQSDNK